MPITLTHKSNTPKQENKAREEEGGEYIFAPRIHTEAFRLHRCALRSATAAFVALWELRLNKLKLHHPKETH